jgi:hypothetical protein
MGLRGIAGSFAAIMISIETTHHMDRIFQNFIEHLSSARDHLALRDAMAETAAALELSCFAYLSMPRQPGAIARVISTYQRIRSLGQRVTWKAILNALIP